MTGPAEPSSPTTPPTGPTLGPVELVVPLAEVTVADGGGKAGALGAAVRAGLPVPAGFVVTVAAYRAVARRLALPAIGGPDHPITGGERRLALARAPLPSPLAQQVSAALDAMGGGPVAVRSSATTEDGPDASAAGQYDSFLGRTGETAVIDAVRSCWASLWSDRAAAYHSSLRHSTPSPAGTRRPVPGPTATDRKGIDGNGSDGRGSDHDRADRDGADRDEPGSTGPGMAVLVHRLVDAEVSGVLLTPDRGAPDSAVTVIEASWGLGPAVVEGRVTPDRYRVTAGDTVTRSIADKRIRVDRDGDRIVVSPVADGDRLRPTLDDPTAADLASLGHAVAALLGRAQDIEWAIAGGQLWLVQARPVTARTPASPPAAGSPATATETATTPPTRPDTTGAPSDGLTGVPGSGGTATGPARIVTGPEGFERVEPGDILICPFTDPSWTPLLRLVAAVVTETGGALSHAAIVARELGVPAVLGVTGALDRLDDGAVITVDGTAGEVHT
jgi:pyruvate,water dikinase